MRGNLSEAVTLARDADALARSGTEESWLARPVLAGAVVLTGRRQEADQLLDPAAVQRWLRTAVTGGALDVTRLPFIYLGLALSWCERRDEAARVLERMTDIHRRDSAPYGLAFLVSALGENLWWLGRWAEATAHGEEALALTEQSHQDVLGGFVGAITARSLGCRGQADRARGLVKAALGVAEALGLSLVRLYALHAQGLTELAVGRVTEAARALQEADELAGQVGIGDPVAVPYGADLVEALVRNGDGPAAAEAASHHTNRALRTGSPWALATSARCRALVAVDAEAAEAHFTQAIAGLPPRSFEAGRTLLCWGEHRRRQRDGRGARELLRRAAAIFDDLGARPWAGRARSELAALGVHSPPAPVLLLDGLTPQELQVALAVAAGQRNKEVAAALFISPKTVEYHLGHVYTKLNVQSRTQLAAALIHLPRKAGQQLLVDGGEALRGEG
jgi:DNA-binding CsgD family transcriptional regulator